MNPLVIDASVAAKWCLPTKDEALGDQAIGLLRRCTRGEILALVPDIFWPELGNVLWKAARLGRCSEASATEALTTVRSYGLKTVSSFQLLDSALRIALSFDRTVYDSLYVALAAEAMTELVTADERLANALAAHLPVKWLGAL